MKLGSQRRRGGFSKSLKEQRSRLYIISRCVVMLLRWHDWQEAFFLLAQIFLFSSSSVVFFFFRYQNGRGHCIDTDPCSSCGMKWSTISKKNSSLCSPVAINLVCTILLRKALSISHNSFLPELVLCSTHLISHTAQIYSDAKLVRWPVPEKMEPYVAFAAANVVFCTSLINHVCQKNQLYWWSSLINLLR